MIKKIVLALMILAVLGGGMAAYYFASQPPSLGEIRDNPVKFTYNDYPDKIDLHTRLSTLFPRGTTQSEVLEFMQEAKIEKTDETFFECTHKVDFGKVAYHFTFPEKTLKTIQVDNWPNFSERCKPGLTPTPAGEEPIILPLMPLPGDE